MKPLFQKISILGLGLIGGSIALELKKRGLAKTVVGYNRSASSRRTALRRQACDQVFSEAGPAVREADLVILAVPVRTIPALAKEIASHLKPGALLTDVGSTKETLVKQVQRTLPKEATFIGGHPIAGTERTGMAAAEEGLFRGRWWIFTPTQSNTSVRRGTKKLMMLVQALGARAISMSPREHDETLAAISHLPHLLAYSLMHTVMQTRNGKALRFAGSSFRDVTRVAASSAEMWTDICLDNRDELLRWLKKYQKVLAVMKKNLQAADPKRLRRFFDRAAQARRKL